MSEADSPRGRIAQMRGVASEHIPINPRFIQHMDRCLTCRSCETVCPNNVEYGQLIDNARSMIAATSIHSPSSNNFTKNRFWLRRLIEQEFIAKPARFDKLRIFLFLYQKFGLQKLLTKLPIFKDTTLSKLNAQLPKIGFPRVSSGSLTTSKSWKKIYLPAAKPCGEVGLFLGCISRLTDTETINASIYVLNHLGYIVHIPSMQTCCGALHKHGGDTETVARLAEQNISAFNGLNLNALITTTSGCSIRLAEYHPAFSTEVMDISKFLVKANGWDNIKINPLKEKIFVHDPCTLRNTLRSSEYPYELLMRIPKAQILPLGGNDQCCGAAGTYFLDQPSIAKKLLNDKISAIKNNMHYLVTSNVGCNMYISGALQNTIPKLEILHPVTLLARQINVSS